MNEKTGAVAVQSKDLPLELPYLIRDLASGPERAVRQYNEEASLIEECLRQRYPRLDWVVRRTGVKDLREKSYPYGLDVFEIYTGLQCPKERLRCSLSISREFLRFGQADMLAQVAAGVARQLAQALLECPVLPGDSVVKET